MEPTEHMRQPTPASVERLAFSVDEAAAASGLSRASLYRLAASGQLKTTRVGSRVLIPAAELYRLLGTSGTA